MSDLYGALSASAVQRPNVVMNDGPLPSSFPSGMGTNAARIDGVINEAGSLLGDSSVQPYAYGSSKHLSTQQAFLNVPHRVMKLIPKISFPVAGGDSGSEMRFVSVSHPVDEGDVAFVIKMDPSSEITRSFSYLEKIGIPRNTINMFSNVSGVNYILSGLQRYRADRLSMGLAWEHLWTSLGCEALGALDEFHFVRFLVQNKFTPFGVVHGSERQGGLNETGSSPATWPVSFVTTMVVDGNVKNLVNAWNMCDVESGSDLGFVLDKRLTREYTLNHYFKGQVVESFSQPCVCYQLVPTASTELEGYSLVSTVGVERCGWHIARSQVAVPRRPDTELIDVNDDRSRLRGGLIEATFCPVFFCSCV
jgi:hypothetical protein